MSDDISPGGAAPQSGDGERPRKVGRAVTAAVAATILVVGGAAIAVTSMLGGAFDALGAIPDDVDIVVTVDLLQFTESDRLDALIETFAVPMEEAGHIERSDIDVRAQISHALEEEFQVDLEDDILPWVGRSMAIGGWIPSDLESDEIPDVVFSMSIRDRTAAADFVRTMDESVEVAPLEDGDLFTPGDDREIPVVWVGDDLLLIASNRSSLRSALDARRSGSLSEADDVTELARRLPEDRIGTLFLTGGFFDTVVEAAGAASGASGFDPTVIEDIHAVAVSASLPDDGVRFDFVQLLAEDADTGAYDSAASGPARLPPDTIGYVASVIPEGLVEDLIGQFEQADPAMFEEMASDAESELGVDLFGDTLPSIAGESLLAVLSTRDGMLADEAGVPVGLLGSLGLDAPEPMEAAVSALEDVMLDAGGVEIRDGLPSVAVIEGSEVLAYQVTEDALVVGSAATLVEEFLSGEGGLADSPLHRELDGALPGEGLSFYVDMHRVFDLADMSAEDRAIADPVRGIGVSASADGNVVVGAVLILVDYLPG